ncbi:sugar ABC transporter substrate-binding protein [Cellulosimicrobium arenosum]|uniref:Extracellular solute-binding protein n=1 Tax=Cellulosimicrobium arenosum TaxID=2708133 RepID=A0A927IYJ3_9MICO|nr:extracellular solute-binding protein [Cellulosimicrobium arenosum]MBD8077483.1 extracellular solute-binding protein [Cellulosimicrobium arenosum]
MRRSILLAAALTTTLALGACSSGGSGDETTDEPSGESSSTASGGSLTIWVDETRQDAVTDAAQSFEDETGTAVDVVLKNFDEIRADFLAQVPTGEGPDITVGAHDWLGELTTNGVVAPLELGDTAAGFEDVSLAAFTQDGQVYGLPYAIENIALIRNTALADEAPATWDDAIAAGEAAGTKFPILVQSDGDKGDPYTHYPFQTSFGAPVFEQNEDGSYTSELAMGGPEGQAYAEWLGEQGAAGNLSQDTTYDIAVEAFKNGESPFIVGGPWMIESFEGLDLSIDPVPAAGDQPAQPFVGVQGFYLSAESDDAIVANDFLVNYMSTEDAQVALYEAGGRPPALTAAADTAAADDPIVAGFREVGADAVPMPSIPEMASVWSFWGVTEAAIVNGADPVSSWDKMIEDIQSAMDA